MTEKTKLLHKELTEQVIGAFFDVYNELGYGFLEHVYANALSLALQMRGLRLAREVPLEVLFRGQPVGAHRLDMLVEHTLVLEIKSGAALVEADERQLFNYLRASSMSVGLLLHFGPTPKFRRFVWTGRQFER